MAISQLTFQSALMRYVVSYTHLRKGKMIVLSFQSALMRYVVSYQDASSESWWLVSFQSALMRYVVSYGLARPIMLIICSGLNPL